MILYKRICYFMFFFAATSCTTNPTSPNPTYSFEKNIQFNHLYFVIDDATYRAISDSVPFIMEFAYYKESETKTDGESWAGKYLYGEHHYLEIFRPGGYEDAMVGDFGIAFMPNKMGTLDSLYHYWSARLDSVERENVTYFANDGVTYPWFTSLSVYTRDTLPLSVWLMENDKEEMLFQGFTEEDLKKEIDYSEYTRHARATMYGKPLDSISHERLFEKVKAIHLVISKKELDYLRQNLLDFDFTEKENVFHGNDIDIHYEISENKNHILKQIDFLLTESKPQAEYNLNNLVVKVEGKDASFRFGY